MESLMRLARGLRIALKYRGLLALERLGWTGLRKRLGGDPDRPFEKPQAMRLAFTELGTTYIKLGQVIASGEGLFPQPYVDEFQSLLDQVPAFPSEQARTLLERELGKPIGEVFASFDDEPMAAASIAQVHAARLHSGEDVVVKLQRPDIADRIESDLRILRGAAWIAERLVPDADLLNPVGVVDDFTATIREELDFRREAATMDEFNDAMVKSGLDDCVAPRAHWDLTTSRALVMERFHGYKLTDVEAVMAQIDDPEAWLIRGMRAWLESYMNFGFFHGDVHAGNFMLVADGRIGFLDWGIVGRFEGSARKLLNRYLVAFNTGAFQRLGEIMVLLGSPKEPVDLDELSRDLEEAYGPLIHKTFRDIQYGDILPRIQEVAVKHKLRLIREMILGTKQFIYFDRYAKILAPHLNVFTDPRLMPEVMKSRRQLEGLEHEVDHEMAERIQDHYFSGEIDEILASERGEDDAVSLVVPPWEAKAGANGAEADAGTNGNGANGNGADGSRRERVSYRNAGVGSLLDYDVLMWEGAAGRFMGPTYAQAFAHPDKNLYTLYEKAKYEQWNATTDVDWSGLAEVRNLPPIVRQALANVQSQLHYGELAALMVTSKIVGAADDLIAKYYGSTQVMDEARHVEFFSRVIRALGVTGKVSTNLEELCQDVYTMKTPDELLLGMQVIVEGLAQTTFVEGAALARKMDLEIMGAEELKALNMLFAEYLMRFVGHDESRHVAFGVYYLTQKFADRTKAEKHHLQEKAAYWAKLVDATIEESRDDMAMVGINVDHLTERCTKDRRRRLERIGLEPV